ncbi:sec-independent protein translocase TatC [Hymenobacter sp. HMF4947]|uniref:Sec-independent protein translocase TatC n=1 Tax=Hymenobacter ginkgonis TaxID=2682976 RepID=A0A7K1T9K0_9BACT|nr:group III truncated hemoglobin [Hymenobacter ginkgonis]MVN75079.1 sec-independent protein translocase TatC [Hymenobacter ginkgonis]
MSDISTEADVKTLVDSFYERVQQDALLAPIFLDFAHVDFSHHLPQLYDFWSGILLGTNRYRGFPMRKHFPLPISLAHFQQWLALFTAAVDAHFAGPTAELAKQQAVHIGRVFATRLGLLQPTIDGA